MWIFIFGRCNLILLRLVDLNYITFVEVGVKQKNSLKKKTELLYFKVSILGLLRCNQIGI